MNRPPHVGKLCHRMYTDTTSVISESIHSDAEPQDQQPATMTPSDENESPRLCRYAARTFILPRDMA